MATFTNFGEEFVARTVYRPTSITRPATFDVLLYDNGTDTLDDQSDIAAIDTEPTGGNYTRQPVSFDGPGLAQSLTADKRVRTEWSVTFDVRQTVGTIDAWAAVVSFESSVVAADVGATPHLLTYAPLEQGAVSLAANDEIVVNGAFDED